MCRVVYVHVYTVMYTVDALTAIQSSLIMLPLSVLLAMAFRNIQPRPAEQRLIKDLLVYDEDDAYVELVHTYKERKTDIDKDTYKSLSVDSLAVQTKTAIDAEIDDDDDDKESSSSSLSSFSSTSSSAETDDRPTEDEFVTPNEGTLNNVVENRCHFIFDLSLAFLVDFCNFCTTTNGNEYSTITCNFLT